VHRSFAAPALSLLLLLLFLRNSSSATGQIFLRSGGGGGCCTLPFLIQDERFDELSFLMLLAGCLLAECFNVLRFPLLA
jgi:hypothetical protein